MQRIQSIKNQSFFKEVVAATLYDQIIAYGEGRADYRLSNGIPKDYLAWVTTEYADDCRKHGDKYQITMMPTGVLLFE